MMSIKPVKSSPVKAAATAKSEPAAKADPTGKTPRPKGPAAKADPTGKTPRPKGEGPDNLRQRAEWFRRRTGAEER
jgi:hypothetical protein